MPLYVLVAAVAVAGSLPLLWWAVASGRGAPKAVPIAPPSGHGTTDVRDLALQTSASQRTMLPIGRNLLGFVRRLTPVGWIESLERRITLAGRPTAWPIERVLIAKVVLGGSGLALGLLVFASDRTLLRLGFWIAFTALAYFAPDLLLHSRGQERQQVITRELPDTLDQMSISVEAGLGFEAAMSRVGRTGDGPLAAELVRTLQDIQVGVARTRALRDLGDRTECPELRHFVHAIVQAESYGIPIADVLRTQAAEQRVKRSQRAEEKAMKIPVKIIFPLILCILPTLFIVILGPAAIQMSRTLFGGDGPF